MGIDIYMIVDGKWLSLGMDGEARWTGAKGYLLNPGWGFPDEPKELDFIKETPKVLEYVRSHIEFNESQNESLKRFSTDKLYDAGSIFEYIDEVRSALETLYNTCQFNTWEHRSINKAIQLVDFMRLGCELQLAGKHPEVAAC